MNNEVKNEGDAGNRPALSAVSLPAVGDAAAIAIAHTPGPWDKSGLGIVNKGGVNYPQMPDETRMPGESWLDMRQRIRPELDAVEREREANIRLRAAAPDLLAALILIATAKDRGFGIDYARGCAESAIAKATAK